jgi:hypothetical protein
MTDNETMVQEGLTTIEGAMEFLDISRASLYRLINDGILPTVKLVGGEADTTPGADRPGGEPGDGRGAHHGLNEGRPGRARTHGGPVR